MKALLIACILYANMLNAQCPTDRVNLYTQNDVIAFAQEYPNCDSVGILHITGDVESLLPLINIKHAKSIGIVNTTLLQDLLGLDSLKSIEEIFIKDNESLRSINALSGLTSLKDLSVLNNKNLESITGIEKIEKLGLCEIKSNEILDNLNGLVGLKSCRELRLSGNFDIQAFSSDLQATSISISNNNRILSISELANEIDVSKTAILGLSEIDRFALDGIEELDSLHILVLNEINDLDLDGFARLDRVISGIYIQNCNNIQNLNPLFDKEVRRITLTNLPNLTDISGLNNLKNASVTILDNAILEDISVFDQSDSIRFEIKRNPMLNDCDKLAICNGLYADNGSVDIVDNATGCISNEEVKSQCLTSTQNIENLTSIYPNPVTDDLYLDSEATYDSYEIFDMHGKLISEGDILHNKISFSSLSSNTYLLKLQNNWSIDIVKIIKI